MKKIITVGILVFTMAVGAFAVNADSAGKNQFPSPRGYSQVTERKDRLNQERDLNNQDRKESRNERNLNNQERRHEPNQERCLNNQEGRESRNERHLNNQERRDELNKERNLNNQDRKESRNERREEKINEPLGKFNTTYNVRQNQADKRRSQIDKTNNSQRENEFRSENCQGRETEKKHRHGMRGRRGNNK